MRSSTPRAEKSSSAGAKYILVRPDPQVIWTTPKQHPLLAANTTQTTARSNTGGGKWSNLRLPEQWQVHYKELTFNVKPMNFKHTGVFPEQAANWDFMRWRRSERAGRPDQRAEPLCLHRRRDDCAALPPRARASAMWTRRRAWSPGQRKTRAASGLEDQPIRWIVDDCGKFVEREIRRGRRYDAIIMDPPSYGRGPSGEVWKLEENLYPFVELASKVLSRTTRCL